MKTSIVSIIEEVMSFFISRDVCVGDLFTDHVPNVSVNVLG